MEETLTFQHIQTFVGVQAAQRDRLLFRCAAQAVPRGACEAAFWQPIARQEAKAVLDGR